MPNVTKTSVLSSFLAGATSSAIAKTAVAPLELAKINFQVSDMSFTTKNMVAFLSKTAREDGPRAPWRGNTATIARIFPSSGIAFAAKDAFKHLLNVDRQPDEEAKPARGFLAGAMAGMLAHTATYPLDVARTTMVVSSPKIYGTLSQAIRGTMKKEGFRGLYAGYSASLIGVVPNAAIRFGMYGLLKQVYVARKGTELNPIQQGACGAASGATGMLFTYPLEVVRRHQQMAALKEEKKKNFVDTIKAIAIKEGTWRGLYKGVSINCLIGPLQAGVAFAGFENAKEFMQKLLS